MTSHIQNVGHVGVDGVADVDCAGLRIGGFKLKGNFQIILARNAGTVIQGRHETFPVCEAAAQRNVNVGEGGILSSVLDSFKSELGNVGLNSKHGNEMIVGELFDGQTIVAKSPKVRLLETEFLITKAEIEMSNAVTFENVLLQAFAEIISARSNLFVETKNQNRLGKINILKDGFVSRRGVGNGIDQLQVSDTGKFNFGPGHHLSFNCGRESSFLQTHLEFPDEKSIRLASRCCIFPKNVVLRIKKCKANVQFSQDIQRNEPGNSICHKVGTQEKGKLKEGKEIKVKKVPGEDVGCIVFPNLGSRRPLVAFLGNAICRMGLLGTKISL